MASDTTAATSPAFKEEWLSGPHNTSFYTRLYTPTSAPRAVLVFAHGFVEHVGRYAHVFPKWADKGIAVFAFDMRGFGRTALDKKRSAGSSYGKTNAGDQRADLRWALGEAGKRWPNLPLFMMGHSMGGGLVLSYCTLEKPTNLHGVIVTSPLISQAVPAPKLLRKVGKVLSVILPNSRYPSSVNIAYLSRDPNVGKAYNEDPLVVQSGTLRGITEMLEAGEALSTTGYQAWPKTLPVLFIHGTGDKVTSFQATKDFYEKIVADDKKLSLYEGGYHELQNEPDGVSDKLINECITWLEAHLSSSTTAAPASEAPVAAKL